MKDKKNLLIILASIGAFMILLLTTLLVLNFTVWKVDLNVNATQIDDSQKIKVVWDVSKDVKDVEIVVSHQGRAITTTRIHNQKDVLKGSYVVDGFYGNIDVSVKVKRGLRNTTETQKVKVFADEYNIAPITATMPVTLFSLNLKEITNDGEIPTFVWFKRSDAWDYSKMPENVYTMPIATAAEIRSNTNQRTIYSKTSKWVKELYDLNPDSHFNFYYNDYYAYGWMQATIANGIPAENYDVTLLSDGIASLTYFNEHFVADDAQYTANYNAMKADYETLKTQIATKGYYKEDDKSFKIEAGDLREYAYIMAKEESNVTWWLGLQRPQNTMYDINNVSEGETLRKQDVLDLYSGENAGKIVCKFLATCFNALTEEEQQELKNLYAFDNTLFEKAEKEGKKAMVILGTWQSDEANFVEYVAATKAYYGTEDYVYYYKGHPRNPTQTVDGKMEYLNSLGLIDVDSTIAAELLFFYFPELLVCTGYVSSTYQSLTVEQSGSVWNVTESAFNSDAGISYQDKIDACYTIADASNESYGSFVNSEHKTVLIEEMDSDDVYLYDTVSKTIKHLVKNEGYYELAA